MSRRAGLGALEPDMGAAAREVRPQRARPRSAPSLLRSGIRETLTRLTDSPPAPVHANAG
jgi:hypothetical protein